MTVMIDKFFGVPREIVRDGKLKNLGGVASKLLMVLWCKSEQYCTRTLRFTTAELEELTGCSRNALIKARAALVSAGLVQAEPYGVKGFVFHLCDPNTGKPWPGNPKQRILYVKKVAGSRPISSDGERLEKPRLNAALKPAALERPQSENPSLRAESAIGNHLETALISPPISWGAAEQSHLSSEIGLGGTNFPFGFNNPTLDRAGSDRDAKSLHGLFKN
jgi:hypothetical protein